MRMTCYHTTELLVSTYIMLGYDYQNCRGYHFVDFEFIQESMAVHHTALRTM